MQSTPGLAQDKRRSQRKEEERRATRNSRLIFDNATQNGLLLLLLLRLQQLQSSIRAKGAANLTFPPLNPDSSRNEIELNTRTFIEN
jgi:maltooligosyltrehalose synthase